MDRIAVLSIPSRVKAAPSLPLAPDFIPNTAGLLVRDKGKRNEAAH
ncbi:hypothetical protein [Caldifermentibacillus hisashii]